MRHDLSAIPDAVEAPAGRSLLLFRLYRDIGLAAVAAELKVVAKGLEAELEESIDRGSRYLAAKPAGLGSMASPRAKSA
jgi:hypothetical protein